MAKAAFRTHQGILMSKNTTLSLRIRILKTYIWTVALYGCETWTLKKNEELKMEAFEMWCYRQILRIGWVQRRTNESVIQEIGEDKKILDVIRKRRMCWIRHILRHQGLLLTAMAGLTEGKRGRGRREQLPTPVF